MSENDFFDEMPIVLSVSRLPQRLDETPGAVTILDRDMIRRSGARDVADLLRLVPGFQTSNAFEGDLPQATYHGGFNSYSGRMQVLVDGRSAYSTYLFGSVGPGLMSVALEDIERIEVLRGSNSAAYGARAILGVVNIVTQHTEVTQGVQAKISTGQNGIRDAQAALGWRTDQAGFRLSVDSRADDGLAGSNGHNQVRRVNFRSDWRASLDDEVQFRAGMLGIDAGRGFAGQAGSPPRDGFYESGFMQIDWHRTLGPNEDLALLLSRTQEDYRDSFAYSLLPLGINDSIDVSARGNSVNDSVTLQHTFRKGDGLRVVWGGEWRREQVTSEPLYNSSEALVTDFKRLFANAEWRLSPDWLLNAGFMGEQHSRFGFSLAPRLMLNWHVSPGHTVRAGVSRAFRPPSVFETSSNVRYSYGNLPLQVTSLSRGNLQPESLVARELGYLASVPQWGATLDVRLFHEKVSGFVERLRYPLPPGSSLLPSTPADFYNSEGFSIRGLEYQLNWKPWQGAQVGFNQARTRISVSNPRSDSSLDFVVPKLASTLFFTQSLPADLELSVLHQDGGTTSLQGSSDTNRAFTRTDVRLAKALRWGVRRGEFALVVQNLGEPYLDFAPEFEFRRRAFLTLRLDN
ncbi:MAG: TonB-dependent receptor [Polaromonas sp.]|nr:TonB-dependent receptor [Polaromonas sp.]